MRFSSGSRSGLLPWATLTGGSLSAARLCIHQIIETSSVGEDIQRDAHLEALVVLLVFGAQHDSRLVQLVLVYGRYFLPHLIWGPLALLASLEEGRKMEDTPGGWERTC